MGTLAAAGWGALKATVSSAAASSNNVFFTVSLLKQKFGIAPRECSSKQGRAHKTQFRLNSQKRNKVQLVSH
jgi:hypothetical protein